MNVMKDMGHMVPADNAPHGDGSGADQAKNKARQKLTLYLALGLVAAMLGLSLASSPLYRAFCRATGFAGTPLRAVDQVAGRKEDQIAPISAREITMRFNGNVDKALAWRFQPTANEIKVKIGENNLAYFEAQNLSNETITGVATFNVTPLKAAPYVVKIACFCFEQQSLAAGEKVFMPISFYIDKSIAKDPTLEDVTHITLSYSFFRATEQIPPKFRETRF